MTLNLDTHILLFAATDTLRPTEREVLGGQRLGISTLVLWEISRLHEAGRINEGLDHPAVQDVLRTLLIWPVTDEIARAAAALDFRSDPCDELIAATSLVRDVPLVTRDRRMRNSKVVPLAIR